MEAVVGGYCVVVGALMAIWWSIDIRGGALRRNDRSTSEIGLHVFAEALTAAGLLTGGILLLAGRGSGIALAALGALLYTVIQSPGYFLARDELAPVAMFAMLAVLTTTAIVALTL
ncbi:MAG TPA: hypothetical protein VMW08_11035 [Acidimicrobiales bacterium]|nr:hypothetical protein [Acidimicrobiales bacterium]